MTPGECAAALRKLGTEKDTEIVNGIRRTLAYGRKLILEGVRSRGIGRAIWGEKKLTTLRAIVKRERVRKDGDAWIAGWKLAGIAAMQETGGQTKAHPISARGSNLAFLGTKAYAGKFVLISQVNHPGSKVPATPTIPTVISEIENSILPQEMDKALVKAIEKAGLSG